MATFQEQLAALAADYEDKARSIRLTLSLLNGHQKSQAVAALPDKLAAASQLLTRRSRGMMKETIQGILRTAARPLTFAEVIPLMQAAGINGTRKYLRQSVSNLVTRKHIRKIGTGKGARFQAPAG